jgi:LPS sulfotransferase NodH
MSWPPMEKTEPLRFMILASARTGSNFLLSLLSDHPSIRTYGEIFNLDLLQRRDLVALLDDPIAYFRGKVYREHRPEVMAVGFKMFYDHMKRDYFQKLVDPDHAVEELQQRFERCAAFIEAHYEWPTVYERFEATWRFLIAEQRVAVIHLRRRNMLHTLISHKTAFMTGQWWSVTPHERETIRMHLEPEECCRYFQTLENLVEEADAAFAGHRKLDVVYETLVERRDDVLQSIFTFLGVPAPDRPVSTRMKKQVRAPASTIVENYASLKARFQDTKWGVFFEE